MKEKENLEKYYSFVRLSRALVQGIENYQDLYMASVFIRNGIFSLPSIKSGLISKNALKLKANKRTPEHFYGRTESALRLIKEITENTNRSDEAIIAFLKSRSRIHYVTQDENMTLRTYNKENPNVHWRKAYQDCGVELVKYIPQSPKKYVYFVDDIEYNSINDVAKAYNIGVSGAYNRFVSKSKNYKNWIKEKIHE